MGSHHLLHREIRGCLLPYLFYCFLSKLTLQRFRPIEGKKKEYETKWRESRYL
ncbi:hypothetical protein BAG01nite_20150 [Brevibacillus agri]|uniref:Uncharacterized protein n=1 Tax=Brevibacillus agri TaxID=51101 RepID=A0ABQ0SPY9_9BACL|nr:hypothetical protein PMI08_01827 [Brevibacillus sp. CF112]GED25913.1 hypothetical protein BAG01nite_20150 [Brevibacillus agri]